MFLAPLFLLGVLAVGVPIWLHRVARANPMQHPFASLMFVEASETQRTAKRTLRYWLLLSLRILLLIALVLAFAGPLLNERVVPGADANARLHAIVIDKSLSMQYGERWQRALAEADKVLGELRSSDRVMVATGHPECRSGIPGRHDSRRAARPETWNRAAGLRPGPEHR